MINLFRNVQYFHQRFNNWPPPMEGAGEALQEEFNEFLEACSDDNHYAAACELVDLIWVAVGYWCACFTRINHMEVLRAAIASVARKNAVKDTESHTRLNNGHIVRKSKLRNTCIVCHHLIQELHDADGRPFMGCPQCDEFWPYGNLPGDGSEHQR